jgi:hypothetical protein
MSIAQGGGAYLAGGKYEFSTGYWPGRAIMFFDFRASQYVCGMNLLVLPGLWVGKTVFYRREEVFSSPRLKMVNRVSFSP